MHLSVTVLGKELGEEDGTIFLLLVAHVQLVFQVLPRLDGQLADLVSVFCQDVDRLMADFTVCLL